MTEHSGRTVICSVVFMDIAEYSKQPDTRQVAVRKQLRDVIMEFMRSIAESERIVLDTGDGAALCLFGDPEDALFLAGAINEGFSRASGSSGLALRTGINLGPVKVIADLNHRPNVVGDGINVAERIMRFADLGEIVVSRSYYEVVARLREGNENLFRYLGVKKDKHVREHQIYAFASESRGSGEQVVVPAVERLSVRASRAAPAAAAATGQPEWLPVEALTAAEGRLARAIGPLAKVIVGRAAQSAKNWHDFLDKIAVTIPDTADRAAFFNELSAGHAPAARREPGAAPSNTTPSNAEPGPSEGLTPDDLHRAERRLAQHIGPLASMLVKKAAKDASNLRALYERLAQHIDDPTHRHAFVASLNEDQPFGRS